MGTFLQWVSEANTLFSPANVDRLDAGRLAAAPNFLTAAQTLGVSIDHSGAAYVATWPPALIDALRATLRRALSNTPRSAVSFAFAYGAVHELTVWEMPGADGRRGEITVLLKAPAP